MYIDKRLNDINQLENYIKGLINTITPSQEQADLITKTFKQLEHIKNYNGTCLYCGNPIYGKENKIINGIEYINKPYKKFCCDTCKQRYKAYMKIIKERCDNFNVNAIDYNLTPPKIYRAYDGKCQYCGCDVVTTGSIYQDNYMNIEHIKPLSAGGWHCWINVTLSCRKCNLEKGTQTKAQYLNN